ncbi:hypothetical protein VTJ49DRAFT_5683 [Mycothermus thermophilus]|uniref:HPt domain-containing protein n=1 Tax=Humicola insolens TaxID=85995 RepID=A0ABR3V2M1_HUMIN
MVRRFTGYLAYRDPDERDPGNEMPEFGDRVDKDIFEQILEMDENDPDREFSKSLIFGFFKQAAETFGKIETALKEKNLHELSRLGHFLKGSSATLGFTKIKDSCQVIQEYGNRHDESAGDVPDVEVCLQKISAALAKAKVDTEELEILMNEYFQ